MILSSVSRSQLDQYLAAIRLNPSNITILGLYKWLMDHGVLPANVVKAAGATHSKIQSIVIYFQKNPSKLTPVILAAALSSISIDLNVSDGDVVNRKQLTEQDFAGVSSKTPLPTTAAQVQGYKALGVNVTASWINRLINHAPPGRLSLVNVVVSNLRLFIQKYNINSIDYDGGVSRKVWHDLWFSLIDASLEVGEHPVYFDRDGGWHEVPWSDFISPASSINIHTPGGLYGSLYGYWYGPLYTFYNDFTDAQKQKLSAGGYSEYAKPVYTDTFTAS